MNGSASLPRHYTPRSLSICLAATASPRQQLRPLPPYRLIEINYEIRHFSTNIAMNSTTPDVQDLLRRCDDAMRNGVDFPTLWHTTIKPHPAVAGVPVQRWNGERTYLEIPLLRGDCLIVDAEARTVRLR